MLEDTQNGEVLSAMRAILDDGRPLYVKPKSKPKQKKRKAGDLERETEAEKDVVELGQRRYKHWPLPLSFTLAQNLHLIASRMVSLLVSQPNRNPSRNPNRNPNVKAHYRLCPYLGV